jgi:hypothetical protein
MTVPKTAMHENDLSPYRKGQIGMPRKIPGMEAIPVAE